MRLPLIGFRDTDNSLLAGSENRHHYHWTFRKPPQEGHGRSALTSGNTLAITIANTSDDVFSMNFAFLDRQSRLFS